MATAPRVPLVASRRVAGPSSATRARCPSSSRISSARAATAMGSSDGGTADDVLSDEKTRRLLRAALARGREILAAPRLMREHCLAPELRPDGIVVQRLMLAPEANEGDEHAVPVILAHDAAKFGADPRPLLCFMHGTGGDSESLLESQLVPFAKRGYVVLGVDAPCHGRRLDPADAAAEEKERDAAAAPPPSGLAGGVGHASASRSRSETFERYGAALVAAWRGGSERGRRRERSDGDPTRTSAFLPSDANDAAPWGYSGSARPFLFDGAWDCLRAVRFATEGLAETGVAPDEASSKKEPRVVAVNVDAARVGVSGISLGGMYAWLAAAAAPETVAAATPLIGAQDFGWALRNERWRARVDSLPPALFRAAARLETKKSRADVDERDDGGDDDAGATDFSERLTPELVERVYDAICPGLTTFLDGPRTFPLVAPRPMLIVNGELDPRNPLEGVRGVVAATRRAYASKNTTDAFVAVARRGAAHQCTPEMLALANAWLDWRLRPAAAVLEAEAAVADSLRDAETWVEL